MPRTSSHTEKANGEWTRVVPSLREPRYSQSLERGLAILACFTPERPVLGIADIADELGMSRSTTHRYVITLVALGYLEQGASRKYRLGLRVTDLGMSALNSTGSARALAPLPGGAAPAHLLHRQPGRARRPGDPVRRSRAQLPPRPEQDRPGPAPGLAPARLLHLDGQAAAGLPARHRAARADRRDEAGQARPQHDHQQEGAARASSSTCARRASRSTTRSSPPACTRSPRRCAPRHARWSPPSTWPRTAR